MREWLNEIGVNVPQAVAGFAGGAANVFLFKRIKPFDAVGAIVVGMVTANYVGAFAAKSTGLPELMAGFIVGLAGMNICIGLFELVRNWRPTFKGPGPSPGTDEPR